jgi:hypothetical protein
MNGWQPRVMVMIDGAADFPGEMPSCPGVRAGSTQPCALVGAAAAATGGRLVIVRALIVRALIVRALIVRALIGETR